MLAYKAFTAVPGARLRLDIAMQESLSVNTSGRGFIELTPRIAARVAGWPGSKQLLNVFIRHTSASLLICENADPSVRDDLAAFMAQLVPDGDPSYTHTLEGADDMPAHIRSVLTATSISIPLVDGRLGLGTWQGLYLWEHRFGAHQREVVLTAL